MLYNNDDLYKLNRPLMMAANDDDDDDILIDDDDMEDGPLDDTDLSAGDDDDAVSDSVRPDAADGSTPRDSKGITGNAMGFGALAFAGAVPFAALVYYLMNSGLSTSAMVFMVTFLIGMILSIWTFIYYKKAPANFNRFDVHSFFKWPEIAVITVILLGVSFYNLSNLSSGGAISLSAADATVKSGEAAHPQPIFAPKPPQGALAENEEVLFETPEFSPTKPKAVKPRVVAPPQKGKAAKPAVTPQRRVPRQVRPAVNSPVVRRNVSPVAPAVRSNITPVAPVIPDVTIPVVNNETVNKAHEDEEGTSGAAGKNVNELVESAVNIAEISANNYANQNANAVTATGAETSAPKNMPNTGDPNANVWLTGVLAAALGYAFPLALAGAILGLFRRFNNPFAAKVKELINEETGEITLETEAQTTVGKLLDYVFRFFVGFNIGGTIGFLLGLVITVPLYLLFWETAKTEPLVANFLNTMGVVNNPYLAYATGLIVAGIMVPVVMLVVGKGSPAGMTITEEKVRQVYSIPVTINKVSTDMTTIPEPAIISFDLEDNEETKDGLIVDEFSEDAKESLTHDLLSEYGVDLESVFGMKVALPAKSNGDNGKVSNFEKQKVTSILENSLGELGNVSVQVSAELGKANIMLTDWLNLSEGMLIELDKPVSEEIDILINDVCKGKGKLTVVDNHLSVRVSKSHFSQSKN